MKQSSFIVYRNYLWLRWLHHSKSGNLEKIYKYKKHEDTVPGKNPTSDVCVRHLRLDFSSCYKCPGPSLERRNFRLTLC